jgi:hypothetical protein
MRHYSDDELVLYHYGEGRHRVRIDQHLQTCPVCAESYRSIADTLATVGGLEAPDRDDRYGLEVWQRIRHDLPIQDAPWWMVWYRPMLAGSMAALIVAAFLVGRLFSPAPSVPAPPMQATEVSPDAGERVRLAAIGDHLEQSERVLLLLLNAAGQAVDVSRQQAWASDLIGANRLYRHAAERAGDENVASLLDELERNLIEIVNGPSTLTPAELEAVRVRLDAAALLFKVRIVSNELRERQIAPSEPGKTT